MSKATTTTFNKENMKENENQQVKLKAWGGWQNEN